MKDYQDDRFNPDNGDWCGECQKEDCSCEMFAPPFIGEQICLTCGGKQMVELIYHSDDEVDKCLVCINGTSEIFL